MPIANSQLFSSALNILSVVLLSYITLLPIFAIYSVITKAGLRKGTRIWWSAGLLLLTPLASCIYFAIHGKSRAFRLLNMITFCISIVWAIATVETLIAFIQGRKPVTAPALSDVEKSSLQSSASRFNARMSQSEARAVLLTLHFAQRLYWAEHEEYTSDVKHLLEIRPTPLKKYKFGFASAYPRPAPYEYINQSLNNSEIAGIAGNDLPIEPFHDLAQKYCPSCLVTEKSFKILAVGNIDDDPTLDVWTIDEGRNLINVVNDIEL